MILYTLPGGTRLQVCAATDVDGDFAAVRPVVKPDNPRDSRYSAQYSVLSAVLQYYLVVASYKLQVASYNKTLALALPLALILSMRSMTDQEIEN